MQATAYPLCGLYEYLSARGGGECINIYFFKTLNMFDGILRSVGGDDTWRERIMLISPPGYGQINGIL